MASNLQGTPADSVQLIVALWAAAAGDQQTSEPGPQPHLLNSNLISKHQKGAATRRVRQHVGVGA
jgi:hypothetical protein